ncbi:GYDIA family GHMP kinase [uncultured Winogradskyella sp.]|uniref:GYDIA family GHMP kinase n=1 Tax=uncultured Winogradskyella sp. TaxID=395353 RepID=UPI00262BA514|nr:GYDIA family GHMP kinase [uncultured Winogradskyella sp.]
MINYRSNGKLLLTGEYLVLDGAKSLALPTKYGQELSIIENESNYINWKSFDENNNTWFEDKFLINNILSSSYTSESDISKRLIDILKSIHTLNPSFFKLNKGFNITTTQDFNRAWGLGTSSTLINNIANWVGIDPYKLLELTFGGSGYDIACAQNNTPITYQLIGKKPQVSKTGFNPRFKDHLYFVYLNQKQNSRDGIAAYRNFKGDLKTFISEINEITEAIILCNNLNEFEKLITKHEYIISEIINQSPIKDRLFTDFDGAIKSLGAWGGDFVLVASKDNPIDYFEAKGYTTILSYSEMIK